MAVAAKSPLIAEAEQDYEADKLVRNLREVAEPTRVGAFGTPGGSDPIMPGTSIKLLDRATDGRLLRGGTVTMWKPTTVGHRKRQVPPGNIRMNMSLGWLTHCPDCGDPGCSDDPNECVARGQEQYIECEVAGCNFDRAQPKRIYARDLQGVGRVDRPDDPNRISIGAKRTDVVSQLKAAMMQHVITFHPSEAMAQGYISHVPEQSNVKILSQDD